MQLLVSVKNVIEAADAVDAGVDILDIKDPSSGALGKADCRTITEIADRYAQTVPVSIALGELNDVEANGLITTDWQFAKDIGFAKLGLSHARSDQSLERLENFLGSMPPGISPVIVAYADHELCGSPKPERLLEWFQSTDDSLSSRIRYFLFDTYTKNPGSNLFSFLTVERLQQLNNKIHRLNLQCVLAGSLTLNELPNVFRVGSDVLGVRGCVCKKGSRVETISAKQIVVLKDAINETDPYDQPNERKFAS